ncbi:MAG: hypothetical protein K8R46_01250 [Pirellulales bacterium]|nr:hypothetical protein [Pirellulales bacterium]
MAVEPVDVGSRLEPIVDDYLVERLDGATLRLHPPTPREIALKFDRPWEGIYTGYFTVLKDGDRYRMYYRGLPEARHDLDIEVTCYAESDDGIHWTKPNLGLFEVRGTKQNNVVLARHPACHNLAPMLDANPNAPPDQRSKALGGGQISGLIALVSPDGIHWKELHKEPVIASDVCGSKDVFDSQNVSFWSEREGCYVCYFRLWEREKGKRVRWIARTTSKDFVNWSRPVSLTLDGKPRQQLYTNQLSPYVRATHVYLGMPTRFMQRRRALSKEQIAALGTPGQFTNDCVDVTLVSARGGNELKRTFLEAFIRPGPDPHNWTSRANYSACGIVQTGPEELSFYVQHRYGYPTAHLGRYTLRPDGFASVNAPFTGGEMTTKPLLFAGKALKINFATSAAGSIRVEIQDTDGKPIPGFTLEDCPEIIGDQIERTVSWKQGLDVGALAGKPIRLHFVMKDADLYAIRFQ